MVTLAGAVFSAAPSLVLVAIVFASAVIGVPSAPTFYAMLPEVVDPPDLPRANSAVSVVQYVAMIGGPAAGTLLVVLGSPSMAIALNAATFAVSAVLLSRLPRGSQPAPRTPGEAFDHGRRASGLALVWRDRPARDAVLVTGLSTITLGFWLVAAALVATAHLGTSASVIGWFDAAMGVGGVLGAPMAARLAERGSLPFRLGVWSAVCNLPLALVVVVGPVPIAGLLVVVGAASVALEVVTTTVLQRRISSDALASAEGVSTSAVFGGLLLGAATAPILIANMGLASALATATVAPTVMGFAALVRWRPSQDVSAAPATTESFPDGAHRAMDCGVDQLAVTA
jgi:predicted MFS family arabinose efflux permease